MMFLFRMARWMRMQMKKTSPLMILVSLAENGFAPYDVQLAIVDTTALTRAKKKRLTYHSLYKDLHADAFPSLKNITAVDVPTITSALDLPNSRPHIEAALDLNIDSAGSFSTAVGHWNAIRHKNSACKDIEALTNVLHARTMIFHWKLWCWLTNDIQPGIYHILSGRQGTDTAQSAAWLKPLSDTVKAFYDAAGGNEQGRRILSVSELFPGLDGLLEDEAHLSRLATLHVGKKLLKAVAKGCVQVLAQWLRMQPKPPPENPNKKSKGKKRVRDDLWNVQGQLVDSFVELNYAGLFVFPAVFKVFRSPFPYLYSISQDEVHVQISVATALLKLAVLNSSTKVWRVNDISKDLLNAAPELRAVLAERREPGDELEEEERDPPSDMEIDVSEPEEGVQEEHHHPADMDTHADHPELTACRNEMDRESADVVLRPIQSKRKRVLSPESESEFTTSHYYCITIYHYSVPGLGQVGGQL